MCLELYKIITILSNLSKHYSIERAIYNQIKKKLHMVEIFLFFSLWWYLVS